MQQSQLKLWRSDSYLQASLLLKQISKLLIGHDCQKAFIASAESLSRTTWRFPSSHKRVREDTPQRSYSRTPRPGLVARGLISLVSASPAGNAEKQFLLPWDGQLQILCHRRWDLQRSGRSTRAICSSWDVEETNVLSGKKGLLFNWKLMYWILN